MFSQRILAIVEAERRTPVALGEEITPMNPRHKLAMVAGAAVVLLGLGGAVAAAHPFGGTAPQSPPPVGPVVDVPEPGDVPDLPGQ